MPATLLDPKNDLVFKKLFAATPDLLADLINAIRSDHPPSTSPKSSTPTSIRKPSLAIALNLTAKRAIFAANPTITPPAATTQLATINLPG